jgi:DNA helicase-2/ATP-dependent DNA helicase PcrA
MDTRKSFAFEERYQALNPEQKEAVDTLDGPVMVIAGPGTGKTEILTMRVANLLHRGVSAERILALTFTESGTMSMRRRLAELTGHEAYRVEIATFHGFANRIIRDYPDYFPDIIGAASITDIEQVEILQRLMDTPSLELAKLRRYNDPYYYLKDILHAIEDLKRQGIVPKMFAQIAADEKASFYANPDLYNTSGKNEGKMKVKYDSGAKRIEKNLELVRIYEAYQSALRKAKQYDYSDMILYLSNALEKNEDLRRVLQGAYDYFLVDEHQDTNDAQNNIIELLADENDAPNLFVVGDEKQAIYRFQGASLENFHYFKNHYKNVKLISLRSNYRSTQAILNAAQGVSPREQELVAKAGHFKANAEPPANLAVLTKPDVEYYFIAEKIKELLKAGVAAEEIAVLYRDNRDALPLARMLEKLRVPFTIESDQDILSDPEIKKLLRILHAIQHFGRDSWLAEALHVDFLGIEPFALYKMMAQTAKQRGKVKLYDTLRSDAPELFNSFSRWKRAVDNAGATEAFEMIVRESGSLAAMLRHPAGAEKLAKLHALFNVLKSFVERQKNYKLSDFFTYLDLMEAHGLAVKSRETVRVPGRVRLMTAHKSKGMEFEYVFIMHAIDRKWGSRFHRESLKLPNAIYGVIMKAGAELRRTDEMMEDENADERNVFYVALTRARKEVFVTLAKQDREGKEQLQTQFIAELKPEILVPLDVARYESDFAARREEVEFGSATGATAATTKKPELEDKAFLNALFEAQGISVTALNNYLKCPWIYFYRNLVRIPEAPNKHLSFGNAVHAALKNYFDAFDAGEDRGRAYLASRFEDALESEPITEIEYEESLEKGRRALSAFYDEYHATWSPHAENEKKIDGVETGGVKINGKLDRIEFLENDGDDAKKNTTKRVVRVVDYKTGQTKTRNAIEGKTKDADGNYKRQLVFYKLLLEKLGGRDMTEGVIQFIEPDDRGKMHREAFTISQSEVVELEQQIAQVAEEIRSLAFWDKGCHEKDCGYCDLRNMVY